MLTHRLRVLELGDDLAAGLGLPVKDRKHAGGGCRAPGGCGDFCCGPDWFLGTLPCRLRAACLEHSGMAMWHSALHRFSDLVLADFVSAQALAPFQIPVGLVTGALDWRVYAVVAVPSALGCAVLLP